MTKMQLVIEVEVAEGKEHTILAEFLAAVERAKAAAKGESVKPVAESKRPLPDETPAKSEGMVYIVDNPVAAGLPSAEELDRLPWPDPKPDKPNFFWLSDNPDYGLPELVKRFEKFLSDNKAKRCHISGWTYQISRPQGGKVVFLNRWREQL